jgi:hypothetical protein
MDKKNLILPQSELENLIFVTPPAKGGFCLFIICT